MSERKRFATSNIEEKSSRNTRHIKRAKTTLSVPTSHKEDYDLHSELPDLDYSNLVALSYVNERLQEMDEDSLDEQLALQTGNITKSLQSINEHLIPEKLENEESGTCLIQTLKALSETVFDTSFCEYLALLARFLKHTCNVTYLKNIKPLELQSEYNKLSLLIKDCLDACTKFKEGVDNLEKAKKLAVEM